MFLSRFTVTKHLCDKTKQLWDLLKTPMKQQYIYLSSASSNGQHKEAIDDIFSSLEREKILQFLNKSTTKDLTDIAMLTPLKIKQIVQKRKEKPIKRLSQLKELRGFGEKSLVYMSQAILLSSEKRKPRSAYKYNIDKLKPVFCSNEKPKSVLSVAVNFYSLSWMYMDDTHNVHGWEYHKLLHKQESLKYDHHQILTKLWNLIKGAPDADLLLMEDFNPLILNPLTARRVLNHTRLDTMTTLLLNHMNHDNVRQPKVVYKFKPVKLSDHFGLNVGMERVNPVNLIKDIYLKKVHTWKANIHPQVMTLFLRKDRPQQELMSSCMLQCLMFYDLLKDCEKNNLLKDCEKNVTLVDNVDSLKSNVESSPIETTTDDTVDDYLKNTEFFDNINNIEFDDDMTDINNIEFDDDMTDINNIEFDDDMTDINNIEFDDDMTDIIFDDNMSISST